MSAPVYTKEQDDTIRRMRAENVPFSKIAERLGRTKNQIIGRANRLGLQKPNRSSFAKQVKAENAKPTRPIPLRRKAAPKGRQCQWIEGDPSADDTCKCRAWTVEGKPYCQEHLARAYRRPDAPVPFAYRVGA